MNFVFCGDKSIINADYLIDDHVRYIKRFLGQGILFTSPNNINETGYFRVNNWHEVKNFLSNKSHYSSTKGCFCFCGSTKDRRETVFFVKCI